MLIEEETTAPHTSHLVALHLYITWTAEEVPQEGQTDSRFSIKCRWYRSVFAKSGQPVCWVTGRPAAVQCILCLRCKSDIKRSYHCSSECLREHWHFHNDFHAQASARANGELPHSNSSNGLGSNTDLTRVHQGFGYSNSGESWVEISRSRNYVPTPEDVGCILKFECTAHDMASAYPDIGKTFSIVTARVRPAPLPPRRSLIPAVLTRSSVAKGRFTVLTYNLLADLYATPEQHGQCPAWALSWSYRRVNLLKELLSYDADIMCLQEVQSNHFSDFLMPELSKAGYTAIYKKKTAELYTRNSYAIDGCATFFRKDKFTLVKKYEVEFNKAALSLAEALPADQKKAALNRLLKDNVALIAVLEALDHPFTPSSTSKATSSDSQKKKDDQTENLGYSSSDGGGSSPPPAGSGSTSAAPTPRRQLLCVANTHIHSNPELSDVKLWQVHTLLKGLEKIEASAGIPMLVAGDFNATPGSAAHSLLVRGSTPSMAPELFADPLGILKPASKLQHTLSLASAYSAAAVAAPTVPVVSCASGGQEEDPAAVRQRRRLDPNTHEPRFTNMTRDFKGTLDYILYSKNSLVPSATLELPDESEVKTRANSNLPNDVWSSDHVALMAEFQYVAPESPQSSSVEPEANAENGPRTPQTPE